MTDNSYMTPPYQPYWRAWLHSMGLDDAAPHLWSNREPWRFILWINEQWRQFRMISGSRTMYELEMSPGYQTRFQDWLDQTYPDEKLLQGAA